jgi:arsenate reductase
MEKRKVLFVCVHNAARSQMAEAYLNQLGNDKFIAESAGLEPGELNPLAVAAMEKDGIDIMHHKTKSVFDIFRQGQLFSYVITVCDESQGERCPVFPGQVKRLHWGFEDPYGLKELPFEEALARTCEIRDKIKNKIKEFIASEG